VKDSRFKVTDSRFKVTDSRFKVTDSRFKIDLDKNSINFGQTVKYLDGNLQGEKSFHSFASDF
jgi:hypothetical protein